MHLLKKFFLTLSLILGTMLNLQAADPSWGSWLRNLGSQTQQKAQPLHYNIPNYVCLEPRQQWALGAMGTMVPTMLWGTGLLSGKNTACISTASLIAAYLLGESDNITPKEAHPSDQRFITDEKSQQLFDAIKSNSAQMRTGINTKNMRQPAIELEALKHNLVNVVPYIVDPVHDEFARKIASDINTIQSSQRPPTFEDMKKIVNQTEVLIDLLSCNKN